MIGETESRNIFLARDLGNFDDWRIKSSPKSSNLAGMITKDL
jgi:hypothetical protein